MKVTLAESAVRDLEEIVAHYEERGAPTVGADFVAEILDRIESLSDRPDVGRVVPEFENPCLRETIKPPFRIDYRRDAERVRVVRIWRSERLLELRPDP